MLEVTDALVDVGQIITLGDTELPEEAMHAPFDLPDEPGSTPATGRAHALHEAIDREAALLLAQLTALHQIINDRLGALTGEGGSPHGNKNGLLNCITYTHHGFLRRRT